jgi:hypothetical protein
VDFWVLACFKNQENNPQYQLAGWLTAAEFPEREKNDLWSSNIFFKRSDHFMNKFRSSSDHFQKNYLRSRSCKIRFKIMILDHWSKIFQSLGNRAAIVVFCCYTFRISSTDFKQFCVKMWICHLRAERDQLVVATFLLICVTFCKTKNVKESLWPQT